MRTDQLDMGFVTWQGQRVFVPSWFGSPRIVPSAEGEVRILKLKYWMGATVIGYVASLIIAGLIVGRWFPVDSSIDTFVLGGAVLQLGIPLILGIHVFLERRYCGRWPAYGGSRLSRSRFMLDYFRSMAAGSRLFELCCGLIVLRIFGWALVDGVEATMASVGDAWSPARVAFTGVILMCLAFVTLLGARHVLLVVVAFMPSAIWRRGPAH